MIGSDAGFGEGAYSSTYLNQTGRDAYLDTAIRFGIEATTSTETVISVDPETGSTSETARIVAPALVSKPLSATLNGSNQSIELIAQGDLIFNYTVADPNNNDTLVTQSFDLGSLDLAAGDQFSARAIAQYFQSQFDTQGLSDFTVSSLTRVVATDIDPERSLSINGTEISLSPAMGLADVIHAINNASAATNVKAEWVGSDGIALVNTSGHEGENIVLGAPAVVDQKSALGQVPGTYSGTYEIAVTGVNNATNRPSIEGFDLQISDSGKPSDLGRLGLNTELLVDGSIPADLAIFVTGSGAVDVAVEVLPESDLDLRKYPASPFTVEFVSDSIYTITDMETDTVVTTRLYEGNSAIRYQDVSLTLASTPSRGDKFYVEKNSGGVGNNENLLSLIDLGKEPIIEGQTFSEAYLDLVAGAGSRSRLAQLNQDAMQVIKDQAEASREASVGVNLDEEAADLIRFQQAYQAAAQVIQISQRMFDTLIQAG